MSPNMPEGLIEASLDPLVTISPDGKITDVNEATIKVTGVPREQIIGADFSNYFTEPEKAREGYQQVFAKGLVFDYPLTIRQRDGRQTDVLYNASVYKDSGGNVIGVFAAARDITKRKRAEAELARHREHLEDLVKERTDQLETANAQLTEADRHKDEFLAMLAHELRNPLAPVRNAMAVLQYAGSTDPRLQRQSDIINRQVTHMARLLDDLLDVSRITRGKITLQMQPLHLTDVLAHAIEIATPLLQARKHTLHVTEPPDELLVEGDLDRLAQVVGNLLNNALKYTNEGGEIWLEAKRGKRSCRHWRARQRHGHRAGDVTTRFRPVCPSRPHTGARPRRVGDWSDDGEPSRADARRNGGGAQRGSGLWQRVHRAPARLARK